MVMSHSLVRFLKEKNHDTQIDVLAPPSTLPLVSRMPGVNSGIKIEAGHGQLLLEYRYNLGKALKKARYDQAIILPNSLKSALVPFFADIDTRTGYRGEYRYYLVNDMRLQSRRRKRLMVEQFVQLAVDAGKKLPKEIPKPQLTVDSDSLDGVRERLNLKADGSDNSSLIAICPGAEYGPAKKWPDEHFATLIKHLVSAGKHVWIIGGEKDKESGQNISSLVRSDACVDLTGQTSLLEAVDLLSLCESVVTNDSGLMHVACALDVKTVVIYGSTTPAFTPPLSDTAQVISLNLSCSPCFKRRCPLGHTNCLNQLLPDRVEECMT